MSEKDEQNKPLKAEESQTLVCPICEGKIIVFNMVSTNDYAVPNPKCKFHVCFRQIFYDVICDKCGVQCTAQGSA